MYQPVQNSLHGGMKSFDHATLYRVDTVCDGENSSIVQFSSMEIPAPIAGHSHRIYYYFVPISTCMKYSPLDVKKTTINLQRCLEQ